MGRVAQSTERADDKRRGWGEGTIVERAGKDGAPRFMAQVWAGGKRFNKTHRTRPEAQRWIRKMLTDSEQGTLAKDGGKTTLAVFLPEWLATKQPQIKPKTYTIYEYTIRKHLLPDLGTFKLVDLRADHLQALYARKIESGLSARTVQISHRVIFAALKSAVRWNLVPRNVADAVNAPKPRRKEMHVWTPEEAARFLDATKEDRLGPAYTVLLNCGLRIGELLALRWEDVDLDARRLQVRRTVQRIKGKGLVVGEPKSARGRRLIVLSGSLVDVLKRWKVRQIEERLAAGPLWQDQGTVFPTALGTTMEQSNFNHYFTRRVKELGLPIIRVHDLRHTCATVLLSKGVHPKVVQEMLGHSQISLTLDTYSHVLPTMQEEAARTLEAAYGVV